MKTLLCLLAGAALLCVVLLLTGFDTRDEARIAVLEFRVATLESNQVINTVEMKRWTLNRLETLELSEVDRRYALQTNLQALIFSTAEITIKASVPASTH